MAAVKKRSGCGCLFVALILLLGAGVAVPKLTVHDPVPVSPSLRACALMEVAKRYDRPYERVALALGQSRVTTSASSMAEVEAFGPFHIPIGWFRGNLDSRMTVSCAPGTADKTGCDVGALCLQQSRGQGGLFGVAQVKAYLLGKKTFDDPTGDGGKLSCYQMRVVSTNDQRIIGELGSNDFTVSDETAKRYEDVVDSATPASLLIYIKERVGRDTGPCDTRVQILN